MTTHHMEYRCVQPPIYRAKQEFTARKYSQNLQHRLWDRESGLSRDVLHGRPPLLGFEREFYKCITPNLTIQNVDKKLSFMRKFTPDGEMLLSFSNDQRSLEVYNYMGVGRVAQLLQRVTAECITAADHSIESLRVRQQVFDQLFRLRWRIKLPMDAQTRWQLNREFSIFLEDGRYVLLAAMRKQVDMFVPAENYLMYPDLHDDVELYDYEFALVDLQHGCLSDVYTVRRDFIALSHNHGVSAYGYTIAILSRCRQCIELLELVRGKLVRLFTINCVDEPLGSRILSRLKQRTLAHLYREILEIEDMALRRIKLRSFYRSFKIYEHMVMFKMQLIDSEHLLIRYECPANLSSGVITEEEKAEFKLYVFYSISQKRVLKVYPHNSTELMYVLRNFFDTFRNAISMHTRRPSSSPSNNLYSRYIYDNAILWVPGGYEKAAQRFNSTLPIGTQSYSTTPYLDCFLFKYDDRLVSALERPKPSSLEPIRFSCRRTNITKFRLFLEQPSSALMAENVGGIDENNSALIPLINRDLVAFIFHPFEPFIISIQKLSARYVVNFHIYNENTIVKK